MALIVILFRDGLEVEGEMLQQHWALPLRKLVLAMPLTALIVAVAARALVGLSWTESFLLGALLSPTDPVLSSSVVTNPRVPRLDPSLAEPGVRDERRAGAAGRAGARRRARHRPRPLRLVALRAAGRDDRLASPGSWSGGPAGGCCRGAAPPETGIQAHQRALYALGVAFAAYGIAVLPPHGNGLIAVFVAAITLGIRRPDLRSLFASEAANLVEIVKLGIFVVFGSLLTLHGLFGDGWAAVAVVAVTLLLARPLAVSVALWRTGCERATTAFMAWFGPKGVATMTFSLLVLGDRLPSGSRIFNLAALTVFCSIILHGATDTPGVEWIARRAGASRARRRRDSAVPIGAPRRVHDPAHQHGEQHKQDEPDRSAARTWAGTLSWAAAAGVARLRERAAVHAWSATCSAGVGNVHATCRRRSWRKTNRSWRGGRSPSGCAGRNVAHAPASLTAQSRLAPKKQSSHRALPF